MALNVNRNIDDQFYRYKMPRLQAKVEGKGNGIKTVVVNAVEVAKALSRPATYPIKFFGCELGAQTQFDIKHDRYIVNGSHDANRLQDLLDGFIKKFVLCPACDNPETTLNPNQKKQIITQRCKACGNSGLLDMRHKLTTFIMKNPPDAPLDGSEGGKKGKKSKDKKAAEKASEGGETPAADGGTTGKHKPSMNGDAPPPEVTEGRDGEKFEAPPAAKNGNASNGASESDDDDDDWGDADTEEAKAARMRELGDAVKKLTMTEDLEKPEEERMRMFAEYLQDKLNGGDLKGAMKDLLSEADRLEIRDKAPLVFCDRIFNSKILNQIKEHRVLLLSFCGNNIKAQKNLLKGIEILIGMPEHSAVLIPKVAHILKALYDTDIAEEEAILDWARKPSKKEKSIEIRAKADPFIKWLAEAESEEESTDEDDDGDLEVGFGNDAAAPKVEVVAPASDGRGDSKTSVTNGTATTAAATEEDDDDDIDIDDI